MPTEKDHEKDHLWAPMPDSELENRASTFIKDLRLYGSLLKSGACDLSYFSPKSKLYILAHGHSKMPYFTNKNGKWDAMQLASLLKADKLPIDQRDIELLVCHAGESVNNKVTASKLIEINRNFKKAQSQGKSTEKFHRLYEEAQKSTEPQFFENDPESLLLPLAAQLAQALKGLGYSNFRIISYKCAVAQYSADGEIYLDLSGKGGRWGAKAKDNPLYKVIWQ